MKKTPPFVLAKKMILPTTDFFALFSRSPAFIAVLQGEKHTFTFANKSYYKIVGFRDIIGKSVAEILPEVVEQGFIKILHTVYITGKPYVGNEIRIMLQSKKNDPLVEHFINFVYQPLKDSKGKITGIFVHGIDITEQVESRKKVEESKKKFQFLANASKVLTSSLNYEDVLKHIAKLSVPYLADFCVFDVIDDNNIIQRVTWEHVDKKLKKYIQQVKHFTPHADYLNNPVALSLNKGIITFQPFIDDAWMQKAATTPTHLEFQRTICYTSLIAVPLTIRGRVTGNLTFIYTKVSNRHYTQADVQIAEEIAARAALAIENSKLYQSAQESEIKFNALVDLSSTHFFAQLV